jgi:hypothetical protein
MQLRDESHTVAKRVGELTQHYGVALEVKKTKQKTKRKEIASGPVDVPKKKENEYVDT